jgi:hypothetical protein
LICQYGLQGRQDEVAQSHAAPILVARRVDGANEASPGVVDVHLAFDLNGKCTLDHDRAEAFARGR